MVMGFILVANDKKKNRIHYKRIYVFVLHITISNCVIVQFRFLWSGFCLYFPMESNYL